MIFKKLKCSCCKRKREVPIRIYDISKITYFKKNNFKKKGEVKNL